MVEPTRYIAAIGNFDGVHRGHQHLLDETAAFAKAHDARPAALTFTPHPRAFFGRADAPFLITSPADRDALLRQYGAEEVYALTFNEALAAMTPEEFMVGALKEKLGLAGVVAGADFRFGKGRAGGIEALQTIGENAGLMVRIAEVIADAPDSEKYSSSAVRTALTDGDMALAARILGRNWAVRGMVEEGQKLGRTLGFPTANFSLGPVIEPRKGVYAVRAHLGDKIYPAVANFGRRPTMGEGAPLLETHLFDFSGDIYGQVINVEFVAFLRDEQKFDGLDALKAAISADCEAARKLVG